MNAFRLLAAVALFSAPLLVTAQIAPRVVRDSIAGVDVLMLETGVQDVVTLRGSLPAGDAAAKTGNVSLATLAGAMLDQGTERQDKFAIADQLETVGATVSFSVDNDVLRISAKCLRKDVGLVIRLIAEQLRQPAFNAEDFTRVKSRLAAMLQRQLESTDARALDAFNQAVYPREHPNYTPTVRDFLAAVEAAQLDEVRAFHARHYGPQGLVLVLVGDVDAAATRQAVAASFAGWSGGGSVVRAPFQAQPTPDEPRVQTVRMEDKPSISIVWGQATGLRHADPDALPLRVGTAILGSGFTGRLLATIRDREGLTYGIGATLANDTFNDGEWRVVGTFAPELLEKGLASTRRELQSWYQEGVTPRELEERKTNLAGSFKVQLSTTEGLAATILQTVQRGYELSWIDTYPQRVQALTVEQVNAAIRRHLDPLKMTQVRAGTLPESR